MSDEENPILKLKEKEFVGSPGDKMPLGDRLFNLLFSDLRAMKFKHDEINQHIRFNRMFSDPRLDRFVIDFHAFGHDGVTAWSCEGHLDRTPIESPYVMFLCSAKGKELIEGCIDLMNQSLIKRDIPVTPNRLTSAMRMCQVNETEFVWSRVLIWSYDFNDINEPTERLKSDILTELYDAFSKGYAYP